MLKMGLGYGYVAYTLLALLLVGAVVLAPLAALNKWDSVAKWLYNGGKVLGHQWIYRAYCIFDDGGSLKIEDCIPHGKENVAYIKTEYTESSKEWDGMFKYSRTQIGRNRAERVERDGMVGYKFLVCARNTAIFVGLLVAGVTLLMLPGKRHALPNLALLIVGLIPMGIDGTGQLIGLWESTNLSRMITGLIAGFALGYFIAVMLNDIVTSLIQVHAQQRDL